MIENIDLAKKFILAIALEEYLLRGNSYGRSLQCHISKTGVTLMGDNSGLELCVQIPSRHFGKGTDTRIHGRIVNKLIEEGILIKDKSNYGIPYDKSVPFIDKMFEDVDAVYLTSDAIQLLPEEGKYRRVDLFSAPITHLKGLYIDDGYTFDAINYHDTGLSSAIYICHDSWAAKAIADHLFRSASTCIQDLYFLLTGGEVYPRDRTLLLPGGFGQFDLSDTNKLLMESISNFTVEMAGEYVQNIASIIARRNAEHVAQVSWLVSIKDLINNVAVGTTSVELLDNLSPQLLLLSDTGFVGGNISVGFIQDKVKSYLNVRDNYHGD